MCAPDLTPMAHALGGVPDWRISPGLPHRGTRRLGEPELPDVARADESDRDGRMGSHDCHLLVARRDAKNLCWISVVTSSLSISSLSIDVGPVGWYWYPELIRIMEHIRTILVLITAH